MVNGKPREKNLTAKTKYGKKNKENQAVSINRPTGIPSIGIVINEL